MNYRVTMIKFGDLQLRPSNKYACNIEGLFDFEKTNEYANIISDGAVFGTSKINPKKLTMNIYTKNKYDVKSQIDLNTELSRDNNTLTVYVEGIGEIKTIVNVDSKATSSNFGNAISVGLTSANPYLLGAEQELLLYCIKTSYGLKFPLKFPIYFGSLDESARKGNILNNGTVKSYPVITITTPLTGFLLTNHTTGVTNNITISLVDNDYLTIDCRPETRGVYKNGVRLYLENFNYYSVERGVNNFEFLPFGYDNYTGLSCSIKINERYL